SATRELINVHKAGTGSSIRTRRQLPMPFQLDIRIAERTACGMDFMRDVSELDCKIESRKNAYINLFQDIWNSMIKTLPGSLRSGEGMLVRKLFSKQRKKGLWFKAL
ncbi:hypothetical protein Salat_2580000, partial [Sesamum alatum]